MKNKRIDSFLLDYRYTKLCIRFYCVSDNNEMYKFWMYYFGSPNNVGQDPSLGTRLYPLLITMRMKLEQKFDTR